MSLKEASKEPELESKVLAGGPFDSNPTLKGKRMSKLSYTSSKQLGLQPGYLDKVEQEKED